MTSSRRWTCSTRRGCEGRFRVTSSARPPGARGGGAGAWSTASRPDGAHRPGSACLCAQVRVRYAQAVGAAPVHTRTMWCGQDPSACDPCARVRVRCAGRAPRCAQAQRAAQAHARTMCSGRAPSAFDPCARVRVRCAGRAPRSAQAQRAAQAHARTMCSGVSRHAWGAVSLLGVRRSRRPSRRGSCRPRVRALCRHGAQPLVGRASATALLPVDARACAEVGAGGPTPGPACTACRAAPGPGACRQRRGEGGAVLGRCALAPARVSASRRAGGGSTRR